MKALVTCKGCSHPTICRTHGCGAEEYRRNKAASEEASEVQKDAERYRWLRDNIKESPLRPNAYAAEVIPDTRLKYELPTLVSWTEYSGQTSLDEAIDREMAKRAAS